MYIVEFECKTCRIQVTATHPDLEIWEMEMALADMEQGIFLGKMCCHACGEVGPTAIRLREGTSGDLLSEKIISPISYTEAHRPEDKDNKELVGWKKEVKKEDTVKFDCDNYCTMCQGTGNIEVSYQAHKTEDLRAVHYEQCPICNGKGYIKGE